MPNTTPPRPTVIPTSATPTMAALITAATLLTSAGCVTRGPMLHLTADPAPSPGVWPSTAPDEHPGAEGPTTQQILDRAMQRLLDMEEGQTEARGEWPYEGVYRVREPGRNGAVIPIGYRVGGTSICGLAMLRSPGLADDEARREAIDRAAAFVCSGIDHPLMSADEYEGGYDVRGWGYIYALLFLQELHASPHCPPDRAEAVNTSIEWYLAALQKIEIPQTGGWNYARRGGADDLSPAASFMTAPALQALFLARAQGREVDDAVCARGLACLKRGRAESGEFVYAGDAGRRSVGGVPGATGRMLVSESTLLLAGEGRVSDVRAALDAFFTHWDALEVRRKKTGTHVRPWSVAPYYFYFAHHYAAQAVELLNEPERTEYRKRLREVLLRTLDDDGTWNDRVFPRSANYGTSMAVLALTMPDAPAPARFTAALVP